MAETKKYIIAVRRGQEPGADWTHRLAAIEGVEVTGSSAKRAQFTASSRALEQVRGEFSSCHIEESFERKTQG